VQIVKVSDITVNDIVNYCRITETTENDLAFIQQTISIATAYIRSYTGLENEGIDKHEDFIIVVYILCQDMWDNRTLYVDSKGLNNTVETILGMHSVNLL
jgi:hypothetical protein